VVREAPAPAPVPAARTCPSCVESVPGGQRFCGSCGFAFGAQPSVAADPPPASVPPASSPGAIARPFAAPAAAPRNGTVPAPPPSSAATVRCIACASAIDPLARTCSACGVFQVQLAPQAADVEIPPPPSALGGASRAPSSLPPPPAYKTRPALEAFDVPRAPALPILDLAPPAPARDVPTWRLVHLLNDGTEKAMGSFSETLEVGRRGTAALADDPFVSPVHFTLRVTEAGVEVEDAGSLNGVFLRLTPHTPSSLATGDVLLLGAQVLRFDLLEGGTLPGAVEGETNVFGSPAKARLGRLVEVTCDGVARSTYVIGMDSVMIGREAADLVFGDDPHLSRRHAEIRIAGGRAELVDLGSSNGTYVRVRGRATLASGAQLRVGQQRIRIERLENRGEA
jgi:pSer/pThr/pTyr-binding forkhead associated (FHA) protein